MPPKQTKTNLNESTGAAAKLKGWEAGINAAVYEEEKWKVYLSMVVADSVEDEFYISALKQAVQQPLRKLFTLMSWEDTLEKVDDLGDPSARVNKVLPTFYEVTEAAKAVLDAGDDLSVDLKAKLMKFQLLCIKNSELKKKAALELAEEEKALQIAAAKEKNAAASKAPAKGGKGKTATEVPISNKVTKLRRRGEEEEVSKFIDDEPDDGPQHYILITGFQQAHLISALDSMGVHVANIIRLRSDRKMDLSTLEEQDDETLLFDQQELDLFWNQLDGVLKSGKVGSRLCDIVRLDYSVDESLLTVNTESPEDMALGAAVFDGVASLVYDTLDSRRQHQHYLSSLKIIPVPLLSKPKDCARPAVTPEAVRTPVPQSAKKKPVVEDRRSMSILAISTEMDMQVYCDLLDDLPVEVVSVPLIMYCMLEQVAASKKEIQTQSKEQSGWTEHELNRIILSSIKDLSIPEEERMKLMEDLGIKESEEEKSDDSCPTILYHHDERAKRLHQLPVSEKLDPVSIESALIKETLEWDSLIDKCNSSTSYSALVSGAGFKDQTNEISAAELQKVLSRWFKDWVFIEHHNCNIFPQVFLELMESYRCVDTFSTSNNCTVLVVCHNPMSPKRSYSESWKVALYTDVRFRHYMEYVVALIRDWTRQEEEKRETLQKKETELQILPQPSPDKGTPEISSPLEQYIRPGSLKAWKLEQDRLKEEELAKKSKKDKGGGTPAKGKDEPDSAEVVKKAQSPTKDTTEATAAASTRPQPEDVKREIQKPKEKPIVLSGYSMNGRLLHVKGEIQHLYPSDGGHISVNRVHFVEGSTQLTVCVEKDCNCFYMHVTTEQQRQDSIATETGEMERRVCLNGVLNNGIRLSYSRPPLTPVRDPDAQTREECESVLLNVSIPTGLLICFRTEDAEDDSGGQTVLVKQVMPAAGPGSDPSTNKEFSCTITCQGTVIKTMRDASTEVLFADGTVSTSLDSGPVCALVPCTGAVKKDKTTKDKGKDTTESIKEESLEKTGGSWTTTDPSGYRVATVSGERVDVPPVLTYQDTDPNTQNIVIQREDQVLSVLFADGSRIVDHADGTRITTFYRQRQSSQSQESSGNGLEDTGVKLVKVERCGFAMVTVNCENRSCEVLLGDRTIIRASAEGSYKICPYNGGVLHIHEDGLAVYSSEPCENGPAEDQPGQYVMCQSISDLCHVTDTEGHLYQVDTDGEVSITRSESSGIETSESETELDLQKPTTNYETHPPRLFVMSTDGSAIELLSAHDVEKMLLDANRDTSVVVNKESLLDTQDVLTITTLKPFGDLNSRWLFPQKTEDIIPASHKTKWDMTPIKRKTSGPPFGVLLGRGLELKETARPVSVPAAVVPLVQSPDTLLVRQLNQNPPVPEELCGKLQETLLFLLNIKNRPVPVDKMPLSEDISSLYIQTMSVPQDTVAEVLEEKPKNRVKKMKRKSKWGERMNKHRFELQELRRQLHALQHNTITPYFQINLKEMAHYTGQAGSSTRKHTNTSL